MSNENINFPSREGYAPPASAFCAFNQIERFYCAGGVTKPFFPEHTDQRLSVPINLKNHSIYFFGTTLDIKNDQGDRWQIILEFYDGGSNQIGKITFEIHGTESQIRNNAFVDPKHSGFSKNVCSNIGNDTWGPDVTFGTNKDMLRIYLPEIVIHGTYPRANVVACWGLTTLISNQGANSAHITRYVDMQPLYFHGELGHIRITQLRGNKMSNGGDAFPDGAFAMIYLAVLSN